MRTFYVDADINIDGIIYVYKNNITSSSRSNLLRRLGYAIKGKFRYIKYHKVYTIYEVDG